jgi:hypothetical protein
LEISTQKARAIRARAYCVCGSVTVLTRNQRLSSRAFRTSVSQMSKLAEPTSVISRG